MNHLWSPWRMSYVQSLKDEEGCVFCSQLALPDGPQNLIVHRGSRNFAILNRFPYTSGHMMIVPFEHHSTLGELDSDTRSEMMEMTTKSIEVLGSEYHPHGFNVGINIGEAAGAGITEHIHLHVVPRWSGDTNFMSSLGKTRVIPETLDDSYLRIRKAWEGET
ncbi:HIT domain-containing protein [Chloroflexota bacterium]